MKIKKIIVTSLLLLASALCLTAYLTETPQSSSAKPTYSFTGLEVVGTATGEAGTYYTFEQPEVLYGESAATVTVSVKDGDKNIPHNNKRVYLESVGSYAITYTASCDGQKTSKTTTVTTTDTRAPAFSNTLKTSVKFGATVALGDYIQPRDVSQIQSVSYAVTKADGTALPDGSFDSVANTLCISDETIRKAKVTATATDAYGNTGSAEYVLSFTPAPVYGQFDFGWFQADEEEIGGVTLTTNATNESEMKIVEEGGEKYLSVTVTTAAKNQYITVGLTENIIGDYSKFDFVDVEMKLDYTLNGGNGGLSGAEFAAAPTNAKSNIFQSHRGEWFTYTYAGEAASNSIASNRGLFLMFKAWGAQTVTIQIKGLVGRYETKALVSDGEEKFDFEGAFGLTADEVKNITYDGEAVADLNDFVPKKSGELKFTVSKEGYEETQVAVQVNVIPTLLDNGTENDNDHSWEW